MSKITRNFRSVAFFALAILFGVGAFTRLYAPPTITKYTSDPICYYGSYPVTYTSTVSKAAANTTAQNKINESPATNNWGPCAVGQGPTTPGVP